MPSRDIFSRDGGKKVRDLLTSFFGVLLLSGSSEKTIYLISPWLSDFRLLDNTFGQYRGLFRQNSNLGENRYILFSQVLIEVSSNIPIRIITWPDEISKAFIKIFFDAENIHIKLEELQVDHQKGLLTPLFYFEGSMNFTYSGVYKNNEKIVCNSNSYPDGRSKVNETYLEFDRIWDNLKSPEIRK